MLGDTAVAVNPNDERYRDLVGQTVLLPLTDREIPIIADEYVDPEFGTGAVKITPAHDPNDYEMGLRHNLPQVVVIDPHAKMTADAGADFAGLDRYKAREKVVEEFEALGLLEKVVDYEFSISKCERCKTVIEPLISMQWFMRMDQLRDLALDLMAREHKPRFVPETVRKGLHELAREPARLDHLAPTLVGTPDSRVVHARRRSDRCQIGRGSARESRHKRTHAGSGRAGHVVLLGALAVFNARLARRDRRSENVLSDVSAGDGARHHLPLGVAHGDDGDEVHRQGAICRRLHHRNNSRRQGQRMSKTKMNGVDPLDVFDKFGVDATRLTLAQVGSTDTRWNEKQVESYRNFANKIWNAARFCLLNSEGAEVNPEILEQERSGASRSLDHFAVEQDRAAT